MSLLMKFTVTDQELVADDFIVTASKVKNYLGAKFTFKSGPWVPENTIAVIVNAYGFTYEVQLDQNGECIFPDEVMSESGVMQLSLYCDGSYKHYHRDSFTKEEKLIDFGSRITSNSVEFHSYESYVMS